MSEEKQKRSMRPVHQINDDGTIKATFQSVREAATAIGRDSVTISNACTGKNLSCAGYRWSFVDDYIKKTLDAAFIDSDTLEVILAINPPEKYPPINFKIQKQDSSPKKKGIGAVAVEKFDLKTGKVLQNFSSMQNAAEHMGVTNGNPISKTCKGESTSYKGFGWRYTK